MVRRSLELDGLRIVAAFLVLLSHLAEGPENGIPHYVGVFFDGDIAVLIFFVLSGYVITNLLARELDRTGTIAMGQFYLRRALRIWPASYAYIVVATICVALHFATAQPAQIVVAATHLWNYCMTILHEDQSSQGHTIFGHFWSLALEEQFYWTWPLALTLLRGRASRVLIFIILAMPLIRMTSYVLFPVSRGQLNAMFHTAIDPIALGAWLSLNEERVKGWLVKLSPRAFYGNIVFLVVACPLLALEFRGLWGITYGRTLEAASAGFLIMALAHGPETALARFLRTRPMQFGGRISYSLYVWQQLYSLPGSIFPQNGAAAIALSLVTATASYALIERPFLILKDRVALRTRSQKVLG
ncbi:acyltransferase [Novosphingobium sp. Fuku2-ISO-50]|uniref:acyltransferase family protein n=1 Tax=Novosphingobium sp. Fuku2-ISO-50 TaxID=1739114 RepID=UPI00076C6E35|nr:acyltransferase [Novosphingobium sp. Fuku2-ISO-50]KUR75522.1 acyltransferase [Novosphingobium sp. Fuku2-ISO-50]